MATTGTDDRLDQTISRILKPIQQFVRGWMVTPETTVRAQALGLRSGTDLWIVGRAGVLGDCDADVAQGGLAFISPEQVREAWAHIPSGLSPRAVADAYATCCAAWGRDALAGFEPARMERIDELGRRIAGAAPAALGLVFAGWRALPPPADVGGRVALTMHVLREMRGAAHIVAVLACGITPLDAVLASPAAPPRTGPVWAEHLGWRGPFRDPDEVRPSRAEAEVLTSTLMRPFVGVLDNDEQDEFAEIVETTRAAIDM
jgi:hypothetical protein